MKTTQKFISLPTYLLLLSACTTQPPEVPVPLPPKPEYIQVAQRDAEQIGQKIWMNEGSLKIENLTVWNKNEEFASLGIGHFIWYPQGIEKRYTEQFPALLDFLQEQNVTLPAWLSTTRVCLWQTRDEFLQAKDSLEMKELRNFLVTTIPYQVQFIIQRLEKALPSMLENLPDGAQREKVKALFYQIVKQPIGVYAMLDYINFKGEGISPKERYNNQGWGLLQVFENMDANAPNLLTEFAKSAEFVLTRRVENSPPEPDERRWLPGWKNRLKTYTGAL